MCLARHLSGSGTRFLFFIIEIKLIATGFLLQINTALCVSRGAVLLGLYLRTIRMRHA